MHKKPHFLFIILLLALTSCKEKCDEYLLGNLVYQNPYQGYETLVFIDSSGDSIFFEGRGRHVYTFQNQHPYCSSGEAEDCLFNEVDDKFTFYLHISPTTFHQDARLGITFQDHRYNEYHSFDTRFLFNVPLDKNNLKPGNAFIDSMLVLNKYYYDVFADEAGDDELKSKLDTVFPSMLYYNLTDGIIKIEFDDSTSWELKEIIP